MPGGIDTHSFATLCFVVLPNGVGKCPLKGLLGELTHSYLDTSDPLEFINRFYLIDRLSAEKSLTEGTAYFRIYDTEKIDEGERSGFVLLTLEEIQRRMNRNPRQDIQVPVEWAYHVAAFFLQGAYKAVFVDGKGNHSGIIHFTYRQNPDTLNLQTHVVVTVDKDGQEVICRLA